MNDNTIKKIINFYFLSTSLNSKIIRDLKSNAKNTLFDLYSAHDSIYFKNNEIFQKIIDYLKFNNMGGQYE